MPALADLETALATDHLAAWLDGVPDEPLRARLRRALEVDRWLVQQHPASLASCLLARTFADPTCAALHAAWTRELTERGAPWVRPLQAIPLPTGLLAELHPRDDLPFADAQQPRFESDGELLLVAARHQPATNHRVRWSWTRGEAVREQSPPPPSLPEYPKFEHPGWGPSYIVRSPGAAPIALPCPDEGSAYVHFSADRTRLIVHGTLDEYAGGFVWVVHPGTLEVETELDLGSPVSAVDDFGDGRMIVWTYRSGTILVLGVHAHVLPEIAGALAVSPDGRHLASFRHSLRVWSIADLLGRGGKPPVAGFPTTFDPTGDRLLRARQLLDGRTGELVAAIDIDLHPYLEGGPAQPWMSFGTAHLICGHSAIQAWDTRTGAPLAIKERLRFPHWYALAYDRAAARVAALRRDTSSVTLHALPDGQRLRELTFDLAPHALAMSPDASKIAVQEATAVEVRRADGSLLHRLGHVDPAAPRSHFHDDESLRFSHDGQRIAWRVKDDGWRIASLITTAPEQRLTELTDPDFADPRPRDWTIETTAHTIFTHTPSGTRIALPVLGDWHCNPGDPRILACDAMIVALCG
jgi:hypothetical protein